MPKLKKEEKRQFSNYISDVVDNDLVKSLDNYTQHRSTTTYKHSLNVAYYSFWIAKRLGLNVEEKSLIRGALLHDFNLYDWRKTNMTSSEHLRTHPKIARYNAKKYFNINPLEEEIILKHMWPVTISKIPTKKEAIIVCAMDSVCAISDFIKSFFPKYKKVKEV